MKKLYVLFLIVTLFSACMKDEKTVPLKANFTPETPKLASDIMTPEVLWSFGRIGGTQVSPDGKSVIYGVTYFNIPENKSYRDIYCVPVAGGTSKRGRGTVAPRWEEDRLHLFKIGECPIVGDEPGRNRECSGFQYC